MCDVATAALVVGVLTTGVSYRAAENNAKAQTEALLRNRDAEQETLDLRQMQINANAADQTSERHRQALVERGRLRTAAGESGLFDNSGRMLFESFFNEGTDVASIESNRRAGSDQNVLSKRSVDATTKSRFNSIERPSIIGSGLQIAGHGVTYAANRNR